MLSEQNLLYQIALTKVVGVGDIIARQLLEVIGDEETIFKSSKKELLAVRGIARIIADEILNPEVLRKAEKELEFVLKNKLQTFFITQDDYPKRLVDCIDAPILLYYKGNSDLNTLKIISIVGTRKATSYGNSFCDKFIEDIAAFYPDTLIVSGLAYGIDIQAHKSALKHNLCTVGVLAHGLDRIYPSAHRHVAVEMVERGGLLTEFASETEPERYNFVRRNRIVAGMADAVVVIESDKKGGSLITAEIANSYNKDVFAVPGRTIDTHSSGCNKLIFNNKAILLQSAEDFAIQMNWDVQKKKAKPKQQQLFLNLSTEEQKVYDVLAACESVHINTLALQTGFVVSSLFPTLLEMEMNNLIEPMPGGLYKLK